MLGSVSDPDPDGFFSPIFFADPDPGFKTKKDNVMSARYEI